MSEEAIRRANEARQLLANPLLIEAFKRVEEDAFEQALESLDSVERDRWLTVVGVVRELPDKLKQMITEGEAEVRRTPTAA